MLLVQRGVDAEMFILCATGQGGFGVYASGRSPHSAWHAPSVLS